MKVRLKTLTESKLDKLIAELQEKGTTKLILLGRSANVSESADHPPEAWQKASVVYKLASSVQDLLKRISVLTQLTSLSLIGNKFNVEEMKHLRKLYRLISLDLSHNEINDERMYFLESLTGLQELSLGSNLVGPGGLIYMRNLKQLTSLVLSNNDLGAEGAFIIGAFRQLKSLHINNNRIMDTGIPALEKLIRLTSLSLGCNLIGNRGAAALNCLTQLRSLDLSSNDVDNDGAISLANLTSLTSLNLSNNNVGDAGAASLASLSNLTSLNLSSNRIGDIGAASLASLSNLKSLNLSSNRIGDEGSASLESLKLLNHLYLNNNHICDTGAESLRALTQLTSLSLNSNQIGDAGAASLASLAKLTSLSLEFNNIGKDGASCLALLKDLTSLNLNNNMLGDSGAASLAVLTKLKALSLKSNMIGDAGAASLASLIQLSDLNLEYNLISDDGIVSLTRLVNLISIKLRNNRIYDAKPLSSLIHLKYLDIYPGNPLNSLPPEIIKGGNQTILNYLCEMRLQGLDHLYEAKILILGEGKAGKTSLLRRLYLPDQGLPEEDESTRGIDIFRTEFRTSNGKLFYLNIWDFAGQEIYHHTHQFFLTKRSLYILVDDTRNNSITIHDEGFKYWLEVIEAFSERCPVFIFQNEKSDRSKKIDVDGIKGRFSNVIDVYRGNLSRPGAVKALNEAICLKVQELPHVGDEVPKQWVLIRKELDVLKKHYPYISERDYLQVYERYLPKDQSKALLLSQYFHDLGVFLHFQDDPLLSRTVILQNDWATEAVFKVLDDEPTKARMGYFDLDACRRIWFSSSYSDKHPELLALMVRFELCYKLPEHIPDTWLSPQLLSPSIPEEFKEWADVEDLVLAYRYDFLPKGMISRLIVRMHRFIQNPNRCWRSGAFFEDGESKLLASIRGQSGQEIELRARGPQRKSLLTVIASDLDALNSSFEGLRGKVQKLVPCQCSQCITSIDPFRFDEPTLLRAKQCNVPLLRCNYSFQEVRVLRLLDGISFDSYQQWLRTDEITTSQRLSLRPEAKHKIIKIFLASSSELEQDRDDFELFFRQENDRLRSQGIYLEIIGWKNFLDAMSETRLQDKYNQAIRNSDIFVSLFKTKTGKYTEEEFYVAHASFTETGKPLIYTYFMKTEVPNDRCLRAALISLWDFQEKLSDLGHFHTEYSNIQDLLLLFRRQLEKIINENKLWINQE